jgi:predicted metal-dependent phosphoesterase TrpH
MVSLPMIDLHTHTTHSDGTQTVEELLEKAERQKLKYISITDHDSVGAYNGELQKDEVRKRFSGKIITGVEIGFEWEDATNEILGYGFDVDKISQTELLQDSYRFNYETEFLKNAHKTYSSLGFKLRDLDEMIKEVFTGMARYQVLRDIMNAENMQIAREKYGINNTDEYRQWQINEIVNPKGKYYTPYPKRKNMETVSQAIRGAGGLAFMAHIFRAGERALPMLDYACENKLIDGVEVYYQEATTGFSKEQISFLKKYAKKHNLLISGGSDSHKIDHVLTALSKEQVSDIILKEVLV